MRSKSSSSSSSILSEKTLCATQYPSRAKILAASAKGLAALFTLNPLYLCCKVSQNLAAGGSTIAIRRPDRYLTNPAKCAQLGHGPAPALPRRFKCDPLRLVRAGHPKPRAPPLVLRALYCPFGHR